MKNRTLRAAWMAENKWFIALASLPCLGGFVIMTTIGLAVGKWVHKECAPLSG